MKKLCIYLSVGLYVLFLVSCSKSNHTTKTKAQLLTAHSWKYDQLINNYGQSNQAVVYQRGASNNTYNLDNDKYTYNADGTFNTTLTAAPYATSGTWKLVNNETQLQIQVNGGGTYTGTIIQLDDANYIFTDASSQSYGKLIPY